MISSRAMECVGEKLGYYGRCCVNLLELVPDTKISDSVLKNAFFRSAVVFCCSVTFSLVVAPTAFANQTTQSCALAQHQAADEIVVISQVYDGDSVRLKDGRKLRIIGINTPELGRSSGRSVKPAEPYAVDAKQYLQKLIQTSKTVLLRYGVQRKDHYGRTLAHIFLNDRRNVSALMLKNGLARSLHVPPNDWQFHCYARLDMQAQKLKTGLWSNTFYQTIASKNLKPGAEFESKFAQISGIVSRVSHTKKNVWINLGSKFAIRINRTNLYHFNKLRFADLLDKKMTVRGYLVYYPKATQFRMLVRHPIALLNVK